MAPSNSPVYNLKGARRPIQLKRIPDRLPSLSECSEPAKTIKTLELGIFFDGTGNNLERDTPKKEETNLAKLFELHPQETGGDVHWGKHYVHGIGTSGGFEDGAQATGWGMDDRCESAFKYLRDTSQEFPNAKVTLRLFGFSRGAAAARIFVNRLHDPVWLRRFDLQDISISVDLMGLFDTVVSVGIPGNPLDLDVNMELEKFCEKFDPTVSSKRVRKVVHLVSQLEIRSQFDLWSIRCPPRNLEVHFPERPLRYIAGLDITGVDLSPEEWEEYRHRTKFPDTASPEDAWEEWIVPGVHADVGGGYGPEEWIPEMAPLPHLPGESINEYVYRTMDTRMRLGATPRGLFRNTPETRIQVMDRMKEIDPAWQAFEMQRHEQAAGSPTRTLEVQTEAPPDPRMRVLDNSLSRISLWMMIERTTKAGAKWKGLNELPKNRRIQFEKLMVHPLSLYQNNTIQPEVLEELLSPIFDEFRTCVTHFVHDSRYFTTSGHTRTIYFGGCNS
ncbi:MAG: DUF2235 domain-containing protein [Fibrobacteria bacterium]|nr:DUF2235 domain-containing protein [Fibrobacteria bacterium]